LYNQPIPLENRASNNEEAIEYFEERITQFLNCICRVYFKPDPYEATLKKYLKTERPEAHNVSLSRPSSNSQASLTSHSSFAIPSLSGLLSDIQEAPEAANVESKRPP